MFKCHKCSKAIKDSENGWHQIMCNKEQSEIPVCRDKQCLVCSNESGLKWNGKCWQPKTKCYYCNGVDDNHETNCRCYKPTTLYTRYINGQSEYCIHGMLMTSKCEECNQMREQEMKEQTKMTIVEALKIINDLDARNKPISKNEANWLWLKRLEALGVLKFDEEKKEVFKLCSFERSDLGMIKVEEWTEGLVLWVGGEIVWKSWEKRYKIGEHVVVNGESWTRLR